MMFIFRETVRFLRHHWAGSLMGAITLGVSLAVSGLIVLLAWNAHQALTELRANLSIEAFFDPGISSDEASQVAKDKIGSLAGVSRTVFISKEQALQDYSNASGEDIEKVLGMNPLPASVKLFLADPRAVSAESLEAELREIPGIADVRGNFSLLHTMESRTHALDKIAIVVASLLLLAAFFYALLAARHNFTVSARSLHTFRLQGASRIKAVSPVFFAAAIVGFGAGLLAWGIQWLIQNQARTFLDPTLASSMNPPHVNLWIALMISSGIVISLLGSVAAIKTSYSS